MRRWLRNQKLARLWQSFPLIRPWRRSLSVRTVLLSLILSGIAIGLVGLTMVVIVSSNAFHAQLSRDLSASAGAASAAQRLLTATDAQDRVTLQTVADSVIVTVQSVTSSSMIALLRSETDAPSRLAPQDRSAAGLDTLVTDDLRHRVANNKGAQFWQSVALPRSDGGTDPGIIVGTTLQLPTVGQYELYVAYNLSESEANLQNIELVGVVGATVLLLLLGVTALIVSRFVLRPIRAAAATSERLAHGELDVRMPERGEDDLARLSASFNDMADSLQARIGELDELSTMQQRFVSDVSHELRTPLTTIRLAGHLLNEQRKRFPVETARTVELLHAEANRLDSLLGELLEISSYDARRMQLELKDFDLRELVSEAVGEFSTQTAERGIELRVVAPTRRVLVKADRRRIMQIVRNLLGNAIEHGEGRPIRVRIASGKSAVALTVRDAGIGIAKEHVEHVFDRFWRADPSRTRVIGGTGLGLAISLEHATAHGGTIDVISEPLKGTMFRLTLPRRPDVSFASSPLPLTLDDDVARLGEIASGRVTAGTVVVK